MTRINVKTAQNVNQTREIAEITRFTNQWRYSFMGHAIDNQTFTPLLKRAHPPGCIQGAHVSAPLTGTKPTGGWWPETKPVFLHCVSLKFFYIRPPNPNIGIFLMWTWQVTGTGRLLRGRQGADRGPTTGAWCRLRLKAQSHRRARVVRGCYFVKLGADRRGRARASAGEGGSARAGAYFSPAEVVLGCSKFFSSRGAP
jgi:hypothetical protein